MIGISWGGFNGLQVAALRPPELKAVISICSTDDRYGGDIHYMGGCLLVDNFTWGASMFAIAPTPPDPAVVSERWRDMWLARLESGGTYIADWHQRQRRDKFWRHASICEDYSAIQTPVYLVGGWTDPYHTSLFRMMANLECPKKALVGPWGHLYPNFAQPRPQIGFLQESIRWWDKWLKGKETGIMDEASLRCYMQETVSPQRHHNYRPGRWVADASWPSPNVEYQIRGLAPGRLVKGASSSEELLSVCSPQTVGFAAGKWLVFGPYPEGPDDQRIDAMGSLVFDTAAHDQPLELLGAPVLRLRVASDKANALLAATLSEILPNGSTTRLSYGLLNLTHRESDDSPVHLQPGKSYDVTLKMNECGQRISKGNRLRIALSTSYFPIVWPSPEAATLTFDCSRCTVELPTRSSSPHDADLRPFEPAENATPLPIKVLRVARQSNVLQTDLNTGVVTVCYDSDGGSYLNLNTNWCYGTHETVTCSIHPDEPLSARVEQRFRKEYGLGVPNLSIAGWLTMRATPTHFHIAARIDAWEDQSELFGRDYSWSFLRDHV